MQLTDDAAGFKFQRRKQRGGSVALVVMGAPLSLTGSHGQQRLGAVQRLNLALLVHAEDQSVIRRVHIEAHDIAHFVDEQIA